MPLRRLPVSVEKKALRPLDLHILGISFQEIRRGEGSNCRSARGALAVVSKHRSSRILRLVPFHFSPEEPQHIIVFPFPHELLEVIWRATDRSESSNEKGHLQWVSLKRCQVVEQSVLSAPCLSEEIFLNSSVSQESLLAIAGFFASVVAHTGHLRFFHGGHSSVG